MTRLRSTRFAVVPFWIVDSGVSAAAVRVYIELARYADGDTGEAFPSVDTIGAGAGYSRTTVKQAIKALVRIGAVTVHERVADDGGRSSNLYVLRLDDPNITADDPRSAERPPPVGRATDPRSASRPLTRSIELERETPLPPASPEAAPSARVREEEPEGFGDWYARYPRHTGRRAAARAYRSALRRGATAAVLAENLEAWRPILLQREARFVPYPSTFLNSGDAEVSPDAADADGVSTVDAVRVGRRRPDAEAVDATLTSLWHQVERLRVGVDLAATRHAEDAYAFAASVALGVEVEQ